MNNRLIKNKARIYEKINIKYIYIDNNNINIYYYNNKNKIIKIYNIK